MVAKAEIYQVADRMVAEGKVPKNREIRDRLSTKGSLEDISPIFKQWREERRYSAALASLMLSDAEATALANAVASLRAPSMATKKAEAASPSNVGLPEATKILTADIEAELIALKNENARLRTETVEARSLKASISFLKPVRSKGDRPKGVYAATQRFFWNAVMREIYGLLKDGPKDASKILDQLNPDTLLMVQMLGNEALDEPELVSQMRKRKNEGYYFSEPIDRTFARNGKIRGRPIL
ncbi:hypothetical protein FV218_11890 [Methylobacterium sp. WL69]|uniref:DNA-binding protein n=1 Tax=Methylobacterium sp. WL69 TaxID=2603893 RepID=UPI0011C7DB22|nr:DNA-binding protein [Methylobacterium sp. WL69]TXM73123.1 hypothetical protein FV218_11890 [Methylobacterium sp. WL69]